MSRVDACPSEDTLAAFVGGELSGHALPRVALHAAECPGCSMQLMAADVRAAEPELLGDRYRLLRKLGEGGMGVVYEAEDLVLGERVALKLVRAELARDERALEYLKSEAKLSRHIGHEHVCRVFDLGSQSTSGRTLHYLSMELLRGPSLRSLLAQGPLRPELALRLADQVLWGLQAAHAAGVLHRDLKPDNMLLRYPSPYEPHAVITDFGLARAFRSGQRHVTASRSLVGSAAYLAPEQVEEAPLTEATDLYSFGVVLFELLTGQQPFRGETALGVALKRLNTAPPRPSEVRPELGTRYDAFVQRCLARDPNARFQSAARARIELEALRERRPKPPASAYGTATLTVLTLGCCASVWLQATANHPIPPPTAAPLMQPPAASRAAPSAQQHATGSVTPRAPAGPQSAAAAGVPVRAPHRVGELPLIAAHGQPGGVIRSASAQSRAADIASSRAQAAQKVRLAEERMPSNAVLSRSSRAQLEAAAPSDLAAGRDAAAGYDVAAGSDLAASRVDATRALLRGNALRRKVVEQSAAANESSRLASRSEPAQSLAEAVRGARAVERGVQPADVLTADGFLDPFAK